MPATTFPDRERPAFPFGFGLVVIALALPLTRPATSQSSLPENETAAVTEAAALPAEPNTAPPPDVSSTPPGLVALRLYNVDDTFAAYLTNDHVTRMPLLSASYGQDTGFVDITTSLTLGMNQITLELTNVFAGWTYGYQLSNGGTVIAQGACGSAGFSGCNEDYRTGLVYSITLDVWQDVLLAFAAPSSVSRYVATFPVTNQSVKATPTVDCPGYEYSLCETGSPGGSCAAAGWSALPFAGASASIPTPAATSYPAYFWLRIRYSYSTGGSCGVPTTVAWLPRVVSGTPDVWPLSVQGGISIDSFTANPTTIPSGGSSTLAWETTGAYTVSIDNGVGTFGADGSVNVSPTRTTTYTLTAIDNFPVRPSAIPRAYPTAQVTVHIGSPVSVGTFTATPGTIVPGGSSTLTWTTTGATSAVITEEGPPGPGGGGQQYNVPVNGSLVVRPSQTMTYTLTATGAGGSATAKATVTVSAPQVALSPAAIATTVGASVPVTVTVSPAQAAAVTVTLTSSQPSVATVPASVTVGAGATTAQFQVAAVGTGSATVTARLPQSLGGGSASTGVTVGCPTLAAPQIVSAPAGAVTAGSSFTVAWTATGTSYEVS
ncbi:MAG: hypothetical protein EDX89_12895, partial [Acidobacteria bacterium]